MGKKAQRHEETLKAIRTAANGGIDPDLFDDMPLWAQGTMILVGGLAFGAFVGILAFPIVGFLIAVGSLLLGGGCLLGAAIEAWENWK